MQDIIVLDESHLNDIISLLLEHYEPASFDESVLRSSFNSSVSIGFFHNDELRGHIMGIPVQMHGELKGDTNWCHVTYLCIHPEHRKTDVMKRLRSRLEDELMNLDIISGYSLTRFPLTKQSIPCYQFSTEALDSWDGTIELIDSSEVEINSGDLVSISAHCPVYRCFKDGSLIGYFSKSTLEGVENTEMITWMYAVSNMNELFNAARVSDNKIIGFNMYKLEYSDSLLSDDVTIDYLNRLYINIHGDDTILTKTRRAYLNLHIF
uniref:N-acetyltransferase domain-containing protein n=1 Tax=viral metagenome TaxID=1070528 RepID=A0A6C0BL63_9ZZZZ